MRFPRREFGVLSCLGEFESLLALDFGGVVAFEILKNKS